MTHLVDPTLRDPHIKVYMAIREMWLDHGESPSQMQLRDVTLYSITTVREAIAELRKRGLIDAPRFQTRALKLTDWDRTIDNKPADPWGALKATKFWRRVD